VETGKTVTTINFVSGLASQGRFPI